MENAAGSDLILMAGEGEMASRMRAFDWANHPLGPPARWPQSLKIVVRIMLTSRYAMWLGWGKEFYFFCNDAYLPTVGVRRSWVLGAPASAVWAEIWPEIGPRAQSVIQTGKATWDEALLLFLERSGYPEETYHTFSYSPIPDDSNGIGGMLCVVTEETERIVGERRLSALRDIAAELDNIRTEAELFQTVERVFGKHSRSLPFGLIYLFDYKANEARLVSRHPAAAAPPIAPSTLKLDDAGAPWPVAQAARGTTVVVEDLGRRFPVIPHAAWDRPPKMAVVAPLMQPGQNAPAGCFVAGLNPYRPFDKSHRGFIELLTGQIVAALSNVRAYEQERQRAEALAELDRAKTDFFSNISHEFRTPLTLMLGPLEEELRRGGPARENVALAHRSSLRLLRLVNSLLDFSRLEAGRADATYEPVDLSELTADIASVFRSAVEKAGLRLVVDCPPLPEKVYVDPGMWEKIVLNLVSNAFKFTFEGQITVALRLEGTGVELRVSDTGVGIAAAELPKVFARFHRVRGTRSRTFEGTGIGLALVQELVKLHGGEIRAESEENRGTTFIVTVPRGSSHLPEDRVGAARRRKMNAAQAASFVDEAARWLPEESGEKTPPPIAVSNEKIAPSQPRILLADDNADMRDYIRRLLSGSYEVEAVADGKAALAAIRANPPALVLSDVMMPELDGFGLLEAVRSEPATRSLPFIMLSARAGEVPRVEGLGAGADDYLTKPFGARELLARVRSQLELSRLRSEQAGREKQRREESEARAAELEKIVARRTAKLQETVADLEHFSYAITHDMRAPLRAMQGFAALVEEESAENASHFNLDYIKRIRKAAARLDQLISDSLNYSKMLRQELPTAPVALGELLQGIIETYPNLQPDKADIRLQGIMPVVLGNEAGLTQCFSNLLGNAVKFVRPGARPEVLVRAEQVASLNEDVLGFGVARIWVIDRGIGIAPHALERVFGMFERAAQGYEGTGIGLAVVRKVIERMGGKVGVNSEEGNGSRFWVELPLAAPFPGPPGA